MKKYVYLFGFLVLLSVLVGCRPADKLINGMEAPEIYLPNPSGDLVSLKEVAKDKIVIIDFWASWCKPCLETHAVLEKIYEEYKDVPIGDAKGLAIYSVSIDTERGAWLKALERLDPAWSSQVHAKEGFDAAIVDAYHFESLPAIYVVDERGVVIHKNPTYKWLVYDFKRRMGLRGAGR